MIRNIKILGIKVTFGLQSVEKSDPLGPRVMRRDDIARGICVYCCCGDGNGSGGTVAVEPQGKERETTSQEASRVYSVI